MYDVIVVGAGLAGITAAHKLQMDGKKVLLLEKENFLGGRTSSWCDDGMNVEAGFHRHIGYYKYLPKLLKEVGVKINNIIMWESEIELKLDKENSIVLGIDPIRHPILFLKGIFGNTKFLSFRDKMSLVKLFILGFFDYKFLPKVLDGYSILSYCKYHNITSNVINYIVTILSTGIFFLPKEEYSAKAFFGLFYPSIFRVFKLRVGAYQSGMSNVIANPIGDFFVKNGGVIHTNEMVDSLIISNGVVGGVKTSNNTYYAKWVIIATDVYNAKKLINKYTDNFLNIKTMSAISVQIELDKRFMDLDRTTFTTSLISSFTEESHSTFKDSKGRLSCILANPDFYIDMNDEDIFSLVVKDFKKIGIDIENHVLDYRVIKHKNKFYSLEYGEDYKRPLNKTCIKNLLLAGDYTRQSMYGTMEGAVMSGIIAYKLVDKD